MKRFLIIATVALMAVACNKNQKAVKTLDGTWNATAVSLNGVDLIATNVISSQTATYTGCKLKDEEFCSAIVSIVAPAGSFIESSSDTALFRVTTDGTILETKDDASSVTINSTEILELTKSTLRLKTTVELGADISTSLTATYTKQ